MNTQNARLVWETPDGGATYQPDLRAKTFTGWIEVEAVWPDGRRAVAVTNLTSLISAK
jgi:hypothetical protein